MKIQFTGSKVDSLTFNSSNEIKEDEFSLKVVSGYSEKESNFFVVKFSIDVESEQGYKLNIDYIGEFETDEKITKEFKNGPFPSVNAPAIAYPYLRSFISLLTLNSGFDPMILPTVNFQAMYNNANKEKDSSE